MVEDRRDLGAHLAPPEPRELEPFDPRHALHLGKPRPQRVAPVEVVGSIGAHEHEALGSRIPCNERRDVTRRAIRPVEILEEQDDRHALAQTVQQREQTLEDAGLGPFRTIRADGLAPSGSIQARDQPSQLCRRGGSEVVDAFEARDRAVGKERRQSAKRFDDRRERQAAAVSERHAAAFENERPTRTAHGPRTPR